MQYAGPKPAWDNVRFRMIPSAPARVAALLAGDVQMIEGVPTADIAQSEERQAGRAVLGGVEPDHLPAHGFEPREKLAVRNHVPTASRSKRTHCAIRACGAPSAR